MFLDTTFCIDLMRETARETPGPATTKLRSLGARPLHVAVFVLCELQAGAQVSADPVRELAKVERFTDLVDTVCPDAALAVAYGEAEAELRRRGAAIPVMDLLIGVTAKMHGLPLLTRDVAHYREIPGLVLETY